MAFEKEEEELLGKRPIEREISGWHNDGDGCADLQTAKDNGNRDKFLVVRARPCPLQDNNSK